MEIVKTKGTSSSENSVARKKTGFISIRLRFLLYFVFTSIVPLICIILIVLRTGNAQMNEEIKNRFATILDTKSELMDFWLDNATGQFRNYFFVNNIKSGVQNMLAEKSIDSREAVRSDLNIIKNSNKDVLNIFFIDSVTGKILVSTDATDEGVQNSDKDFYIEGSKRFFNTKINYSDLNKSYSVIFSQPIFDNDAVLLGVLAVRLDAKSLADYFVISDIFGDTGEAYLTDSNGRPITDLRFPISNVETVAFNDLKIGKSGFNNYVGYYGKEVFGSYRFIEKVGLGVIVEQNKEELFSDMLSIRRSLIFIIWIALLIDIIIALIIVNRIVKPMIRLTEQAKKIENGDISAIGSIDAGDEIGVLADAFTNMATSLISSLDETKNIINTLPNALFLLDKKGYVNSANQTACELLDFGRDAIVGINFKDFLRPLNISVRSDIDFDAILRQGVFKDIQLNCFTNSHQIIPISLSGTVLKDKINQSAGYIMIVQDLRQIKKYAKDRLSAITPILNKISQGDFSQKFKISENEDEFTGLLKSLDKMSGNLKDLIKDNQKKTSEVNRSMQKTEEEKAKAEAFLGSIGEGIMAINLFGDIILLNPSAEKMFGINMNSVSGKQFSTVMKLVDEKGSKLLPDNYPVSNVIITRRPIHSVAYFVNGAEERLPLSVTFSPILFDNKILGVIGTFRDITKEMEVDKAKSEFVSLASHQLRTPLSGINWLLQEILRKGNLDPMQDEYLHDALKSNDRMIRLVNDLLNVSRLETGIINVNISDVELTEFVEDYVKEARVIAQQKGQTVEYKKPANPINIQLDKDLIGQVVTNLLSNAITYTDKNKTIKVDIKLLSDKAEISVADQGIGISKDDQEKLFSKFYRTGKAAKYSTTGSGLGLYIVKKIVDISGGAIRISSDEDAGATFTVILPLVSEVREHKSDKKLFKTPISFGI